MLHRILQLVVKWCVEIKHGRTYIKDHPRCRRSTTVVTGEMCSSLDTEWLNTDDVEVETSSIPTENTDNMGLPVNESTTDRTTNPWTKQEP
ncbi:hypothetical protein EVAR_75339_1 [Eumeta japonica]|uniref:Uncharacterized protein n=1 Tax=Eumeta variegata TaxID=151549 RepID=A0A4C1Y2W3_EUMVA|nr:hypothetical protein EVAR_75339_1 [Eumeta japonica]